MQGVLVGCDAQQEWLLPWWWENYSRNNAYPVAFADLGGMSRQAQDWCRERGSFFSLSENPLQNEYNEGEIAERERRHGTFIWAARTAWFKKPCAMCHFPFEATLWIDLDCEVLAQLEPLFAYCENSSGVGIVQEPHNTGVVVFRKGSPLIQIWAEWSLQKNREFISDQDLFCHLVTTYHYEVDLFSSLYNWVPLEGVHLDAAIIHWVCEGGKEFIRKIGGARHKIREYNELFASQDPHFLSLQRIIPF